MGWRTLGLALLCCLTGTLAQKCVLITPGVLRLDTLETFLLTVHGVADSRSDPQDYVQIWDFPKKTKILARTSFQPTQIYDDIFLHIKLTVPSSGLAKNQDSKQFVSLIVKFGPCNLEKVLLVSFQSGYVFIQTDKPIYTPGSLLYYRIFSMSPNLDPDNKGVIVEFRTPDNVVVQKDSYRIDQSGMISKSYTITDPVRTGIWSITTKLKDNEALNFTTHFEVKEYVLPSFEITLQPRKKFFYYRDQDFTVDIKANYVFGKPVKGRAFVLFGIRKGDQHISLTDSLKSVSIVDGRGEAKLEKNDILKKIPDVKGIIGWILHMQVSVITDTGSDLLEAELDDIHIVEAPYNIAFIRTSQYFKPGLPFEVTLLVTNPDGSPASRVPVTAKSNCDTDKDGQTNEAGKAKLTINIPDGRKEVTVDAFTKDTNLEQQAKNSMKASAYNDGAGNFLHISVQPTPLALHDNMQITFTFKRQGGANVVKHIFYLIQNKGRILQYKKLKIDGQSVFTDSQQITADYLPSFRIVAYYVTADETVADSLWVEVKSECAGKLELEANSNSDEGTKPPSTSINLKLTADHKAHVGLVAVDKAVLALNNKFRLTQSKVWEWIEKYDPGCTAGSGRDMKGVFHDAGLAIQSNFGVTSPQTIDEACKSPVRKNKRRRRDTVMLLQVKNAKAINYKDEEKRCCFDGMKQNPMGHSCERRSKYIVLGAKCVEAFLDCCKYMEKKREEQKTDSRVLDRSDTEDVFPSGDSEDITTRSQFPESFLWEKYSMNEETGKGLSSKVITVNLPDSITTWEVMAVSLSKGKGICVSKPYEIRVQQDFFIDLKLPYSVHRNEQVAIRAVLYNYSNQKLKVTVVWLYNEFFCSRSTKRKNYIEQVEIDKQSSVSVSHVIIPLTLDPISVEVRAHRKYGGDAVKKTLRVVPEGRLVEKRNYIVLDPEQNPSKKQEVNFIPDIDTKNIVPNSDIKTLVTIQGTPISDMVQQAIDGFNVDHLVDMPYGCGEQNMMRLTSVVIATHFLDTTNQWIRIGVDRRAQAIQFIMAGISKQNSYRSENAAFKGFAQNVPSTWLTAYVVRVFALAHTLTDIKQEQVCESVKWLIIQKQKPDGLFVEDGTLFGTYMTGGMETSLSERDSTLTAFVLIALLDSENICSGYVHNLQTSIKKAYSFVKEYYHRLTRPYSVAITSYALAKAEQLVNIDTLMSKATGGNHWLEVGNKEVSIEATSYALLALLAKGEYKKAEPLADWLTAQRFYGRFSGSTQATIVMFQALAEYQRLMPPKKDMALVISYSLPGKSKGSRYQINPYNSLLARTESAKGSGNFSITAEGSGKGLLTVTTMYYEIRTEKELECKNFELSVTVKVEGLSKRKRPELSIEICTKYQGSANPGMCIIDITMLTGFSVDDESLKALKDNTDQYISDYEINNPAYNKSAVILYVEKITNKDNFCISFKAEKEFDVADIQPASVTVYEYYAKENQCTKFYHLDKDSRLLSKICHKDVCHCAENSCFIQQELTRVRAKDRYDSACLPDMDYVYKTKLKEVQRLDNFDAYVMTIEDIIKQGTDAVFIDDERTFFSHAKCASALNFKPGASYIIWGLYKDMNLMGSVYSYMITKSSWVELWPTPRECQLHYEDICQELFEFSTSLKENGCSS